MPQKTLEFIESEQPEQPEQPFLRKVRNLDVVAESMPRMAAHLANSPREGVAPKTVFWLFRLYSTVQKWRRALETAGIEFIDEDKVGGVGVRLRPGVKLPAVKKKR